MPATSKPRTRMPRLRCSNLSDLSNMHLVCTSRVARDRGLCNRTRRLHEVNAYGYVTIFCQQIQLRVSESRPDVLALAEPLVEAIHQRTRECVVGAPQAGDNRLRTSYQERFHQTADALLSL